MPTRMMIAIATYSGAVNLIAYVAMVLDKRKAEAGLCRIPEATLLSLAMLGGSLGTVIAQRTIQHKTRKEPFRSRLAGVLLLQVAALAAFGTGWAIAGSPEALWQLLTS